MESQLLWRLKARDWQCAMFWQVYVNLNNLQHIKNALSSLPQTLHIAAIVSAVDGPSMLDVQRYNDQTSQS